MVWYNLEQYIEALWMDRERWVHVSGFILLNFHIPTAIWSYHFVIWGMHSKFPLPLTPLLQKEWVSNVTLCGCHVIDALQIPPSINTFAAERMSVKCYVIRLSCYRHWHNFVTEEWRSCTMQFKAWLFSFL